MRVGHFTLTRRQGAMLLVLLPWLFGAAMVPWGLKWFVVRNIGFSIETRDVPRPWALEWTPVDSARPRTGYWLDLRDLTSTDNSAVTIEKPKPFLRRLPTYPIREITLSWEGGAGGAIRVTRLAYFTRLFDLDRPATTPNAPIEVGDAAHVTEEGWIVLDAASGRLNLPIPPRPWSDTLWVYVGMVVLVFVVLAAAWAVWMVICLWDRVADRIPPPRDPMPRRHPVLAALAIGATFIVPAWMFAWAPMLIEGDGVAYIALALKLLEDPSIRHYDGWRLPGYAALVAPLVGLGGDYTVPIGVLHLVLAMATPWVARAALRRRVSARWAWVGMLVTACDPMLIVWQRHVLAECLTTFIVMLLLYLMVRFEDRCRAERPPGVVRLLAVSTGLGVFLGVATLVRGNFQIALVLAPAYLVWAALRAVSWPGAIAVGAACLVAGFAVLLPMYVHVHRTFGVWAYTVGPGWHRAIRTWDNGLADWNQTAVFSFEEAQRLRRRMAARPVNEFEFTHYLGECPTYPVPAGAKFERARDIRGGVSARESRDRLPDKHAEIVPKAIVSLMGFHVRRPGYFRGYSFALVRDFIGRPTDHKPFTLRGPYTYLPMDLREGLARGNNAIDTRGSMNAAMLGVAWDVARLIRPIISVLFLIAAGRLFLRREVALSGMALIVIAHVVALPVLYYAGTDRYIMPWWGLSTLIMMTGIGRIGRPFPPRAMAP
ncbi:MAG: hypothetical protein HBSAPP03_13530 [Phycisphaerae bacterium]|nr:MAG: hypothetical protein HBSAPP03_13530 [Phycisphaerae bacterium]